MAAATTHRTRAQLELDVRSWSAAPPAAMNSISAHNAVRARRNPLHSRDVAAAFGGGELRPALAAMHQATQYSLAPPLARVVLAHNAGRFETSEPL